MKANCYSLSLILLFMLFTEFKKDLSNGTWGLHSVVFGVNKEYKDNVRMNYLPLTRHQFSIDNEISRVAYAVGE